MKREVWLNYIVVFVAVIVIALWAWWLFRPQPMPFVLRAKWTVRQGFLHGKPVFSPKGDLLATPVFSFTQGGTTLSVNFWHVPKGSQAKPTILISKRSEFPSFTPQPIAFSPDGSLLAVGYLERGVGKISVFRVTDNLSARTITIRAGKGKAFSAPSVLFSPDGKKLAVMYEARLKFVQVADGKQVETNIMPSMVVFSPDGHLIAAMYASGAVNIYDANGRIIRQLSARLQTGFAPSVNLLEFTTGTFSHDSQRFLCVLREGRFQPNQRRERLFIWRVSDGKLERTIQLTPLYDLTLFTPSTLSLDTSLVALTEPDPSGWDGLLWRVERFISRLLKFLEEPIPPMQVVVHKIADGQVITKLPRFGNRVTDCVFSPDGRYLAVVHDHKTIALWEWKGK